MSSFNVLKVRLISQNSRVLNLNFLLCHLFNNFLKSPISALRCIPRHCSVLEVRLIPRNLRRLELEFLESYHFYDIIRTERYASFLRIRVP